MRAFSAVKHRVAPIRGCRALRGNVTACAVRGSDTTDDRRSLLLSVAGVLSASHIFPAIALEEGFETYFGKDTPPTSYGGYGGNIKEPPKYKFDYPAEWKFVVVNKTQKAFVITLARAGEERVFKLTDDESTFSSFVGADYDLQDAVQSGDLYSEKRTEDGQLFYDYIIEGTDVTFRATITISSGKVYALFVRCPSRTFNAFKSTADTMIKSFRTI